MYGLYEAISKMCEVIGNRYEEYGDRNESDQAHKNKRVTGGDGDDNEISRAYN